jgi:hypothetical protein
MSEQQKRTISEGGMVELRKLQAEAEEAAGRARVAELEARLVLEKFQAKARELLRERGAPVTHTIDLETGEIHASAVAGGR